MNRFEYLNEKIKKLNLELQNFNNSNNSLDELAGIKSDLNSLSLEVSQLRALHGEDKVALQNKIKTINDLLSNKIVEYDKLIDNLSDKNIANETNISLLTTENTALRTEITSTKENLTKLNNTFIEKNKVIDSKLSEVEGNVNTYNTNFQNHIKDYEAISAKANKNEQDISLLNQKISGQEEAISSLQEKDAIFQNNFIQINKNISDHSDGINNLLNNVNNHTELINSLGDSINQVSKNCTAAINGVSSRVDNVEKTVTESSSQITQLQESDVKINKEISAIKKTCDDLISQGGNSSGGGSGDSGNANVGNVIVANPNYLINSSFTINQRKKTEYNQTIAPNNTYTVDRLLHLGNSDYKLVQKVGGGITITNSGTENASFIQIVENGKDIFSNKPLSFSISIGGEIYKISNKTLISGGKESINFQGGNAYVELTSEGKFFCGVEILPGTTISVEWWKLELGSSCTPYMPRLDAEEYELCKRYYQRLLPNNMVMYAQSTLFALGNLPLPHTLRAKPKLLPLGKNQRIYALFKAEYNEVTKIIVNKLVDNCIVLQFQSKNLERSRHYAMYEIISEYEFDAELY